MLARTARPPGFSLCELVLHGFLKEEDVSPGGIVDESQRMSAETLYAAWLAGQRQAAPPLRRPRPRTQRPQTARTFPPRPPQTTARAHATRTPRSASPVRRSASVCPAISAPPPPCAPATQAQAPGEKVCCICKDREKTHAPYPCFHMCMCEDCANLVELCPLCRGPVATVHRIFT